MHNISPTKRFALLLAFILSPMFSGCASINVENMVTNHSVLDSPKHPVNLSVEVIGGSPGVQWYSKTIKPEDFKKAVLLSLEKTEFFKEIVNQDIADYLLKINLTYAGSHPGFTLHAWVNAKWTIYRKVDNEIVWTADVSGEGSATVGDALSGEKRICMALERAAQSNINHALTEFKDKKF
jgi:hypothetical protein